MKDEGVLEAEERRRGKRDKLMAELEFRKTVRMVQCFLILAFSHYIWATF